MVVNLCQSGKSTKEVSDELGIRPDMERRWTREYNQYQDGSFSGYGNANMNAEQKEITRLKVELKNAQIERDILKKAVGIFSRSDGKYFNS